MRRLLASVLVLACLPGVHQWKADRVRTDCAGNPSPAAAYRMFLMTVDATPYACQVCCDETCIDLCMSTCYSYSRGPWVEVALEPDQTLEDPGPFCFDWDLDGAPGRMVPDLMDVFYLWARDDDASGRARPPCP